MMNKTLRFIDLFAGMGGFRLAFEDQGCKCVFSSDIDEFACKTYELNFNEYPKSDITKVDAKDIPDFDILCAGFPCQPFSIAGRRLGFDDTRGTLFFDVARIIKEKEPLAFLLENVRGLSNHDGGKTLEVILKTLDELGYETKWKVLNAKKYGVPQNRERWYCYGIRRDLHKTMPDFPKEKELITTLSNIIEPSANDSYRCTKTCSKNIATNLKKKNIKINDFTLAYEIRPSRCQFANNGVSPCLTAKMGTGGNNVPVVVAQNRKLTERECLRIMGYPESYKIYPGHHTYKQIGNSVVVPVLTELAKLLVDALRSK